MYKGICNSFRHWQYVLQMLGTKIIILISYVESLKLDKFNVPQCHNDSTEREPNCLSSVHQLPTCFNTLCRIVSKVRAGAVSYSSLAVLWSAWYIRGLCSKTNNMIEKSVDVPQKTKSRIAIWSCNSTPGHILRQNYNSKRYMYLNVHSSAIYSTRI